jgi:TetR/AcrR family transcriptional regulator, regulator of biofilm formation and stress response
MNGLDQAIDQKSGPASRKGARTRKELLDATLRIIVRDGHQQVTLRNVAQEAGQSHGLIAYHYGSRNALLSAALEFSNGYLYERSKEVCDRWAEEGADLETFTDLMIEFYVEYLVRNADMGIVVLELNIAAAREDYLRPILFSWGEKMKAIYEAPFRGIGSVDPKADFQFFLNAMNGILSAQRSFPRRQFETKILAPSIVRMLSVIG